MRIVRVSVITSEKGYHFFEVTTRETLDQFQRFQVIDKSFDDCERKRQEYIAFMNNTCSCGRELADKENKCYLCQELAHELREETAEQQESLKIKNIFDEE